jgi:hypothetical protein
MAELKLGGTSIISDASGTATLGSGIAYPTGHIVKVSHFETTERIVVSATADTTVLKITDSLTKLFDATTTDLILHGVIPCDGANNDYSGHRITIDSVFSCYGFGVTDNPNQTLIMWNNKFVGLAAGASKEIWYGTVSSGSEMNWINPSQADQARLVGGTATTCTIFEVMK